MKTQINQIKLHSTSNYLNLKSMLTKLIVGLILLLFSANTSVAGTSYDETAKHLASIRNTIIKSVGTAKMAENHVKIGYVWRTFSINKDREIVIKNVLGNRQYLNDFVRSELQETSFYLDSVNTKKLYRIRINFKLI